MNLNLINSMIPSGVRKIMKISKQYPHCIHLEVGQPDFVTPDIIQKAGIEAINEGIIPYTSTRGISELINLIRLKLKVRNNINVGEDNIMITPGAGIGVALAMMAILNEGDEVLIPDPCWTNFHSIVLLAGGIVSTYKITPKDHFEFYIQDIEKEITDKTKVILINNPLNPTGTLLSKTDLQKIYNIAEKYDLFIISDEIYEDIIFDNLTHTSIKAFDLTNRVISVFGFSKSYAMTGWRIGYVAAPSEIVSRIEKIAEPLYSCVSYISQKAAIAALRLNDIYFKQVQELYKSRRDIVIDILKSYNMYEYTPKSSFYIMINVSPLLNVTNHPALYILQKTSVAAAPGDTFGKSTKEYIRISLCIEEEDLKIAINRICKLIKSIG